MPGLDPYPQYRYRHIIGVRSWHLGNAGIYPILAFCMALISATATSFAGELHDAVRANDNAAIESLLASGASVDESDLFLGTALHIAVSQGNVDIARILIDQGADLEAVSELRGARALHLAANFGAVPMLALVLDSGADTESRDDDGRTPLFRAAAQGHTEAVRLLLDRGAEVDAREGTKDRTPLMEAAFYGKFDVVRVLVTHGADINAADASGRTPLILAATAESFLNVGDGSLIEYLVGLGADIHAKDSAGHTPLAWAESSSGRWGDYKEIAEVLRRLGATE